MKERSTYMFNKMVSTRVMCMMTLVKVRARIRYKTESKIAAAETRSRSHTVLLPGG